MDEYNIHKALSLMGVHKSKKVGNDNIMCQCVLSSNHENGDRKASMSIKINGNGVSPVYCFGCIPHNETITTAAGLKRMGDVWLNDLVLTKDGGYGRVVTVQDKDCSEIVEFDLYKNGEKLRTTKDHVVFVVEGRKCTMPSRREKNCTPLCKRVCTKKKSLSDFEIIEKRAEDVNIGDWMLMPTLRERIVSRIECDARRYIKFKGKRPVEVRDSFDLDEDMCWLIGLYVAEGSFNRGALFNLHIDENDIADRVCRISERLFGIKARVYRVPKGHQMGVLIPNVVVGRWLKDICGERSYSKHFPRNLLEADGVILKGLLDGYYDGDGLKKVVMNRMSISTVSKELAYQVRMILLRFGVVPFFQVYDEVVGHRKSYKIVWTRDKKSGFDGRNMFLNNMGLVFVKAKHIVPYSGKVRDIEVENGASFVVNGVAVHNCGFKGTMVGLAYEMEKNFGGGLVKEVKSLEHGGAYRPFKPYEEVSHMRYRNDIADLHLAKRDKLPEINIKEFEDCLGFVPKYMIDKRGIDIDTLRAWKIGHWKRGRQGVFFPIFDSDKKMVGYSIRWIFPKEDEPSYFHMPGLNKKKILYGENMIDASRSNTVAIVEGAIDTLKVWAAGFNAVGTLGGDFSDNQASKILTLCKDMDCVAMGDGDKGGKKHSAAVMEKLSDRGIKIRNVELDEGRDPGDMTTDEIRVKIGSAGGIVV